jgi:hypothetical protein
MQKCNAREELERSRISYRRTIFSKRRIIFSPEYKYLENSVLILGLVFRFTGCDFYVLNPDPRTTKVEQDDKAFNASFT